MPHILKVPPQWLNTGFILSMFDKKAVKAKSLYKQFVISNIGKEKDIINQHTKLGILFRCENKREIHRSRREELDKVSNVKT